MIRHLENSGHEPLIHHMNLAGLIHVNKFSWSTAAATLDAYAGC